MRKAHLHRTKRNLIRNANPQCWQDVTWDIFPKKVTWRTLELTPVQFVHAFRNKNGDDILPIEFMKELYVRFGFDYMMNTVNGGYGNAQYFAIGVFYDIPKCCIFDFAMGCERHENALDLTEAANQGKAPDGWVLCRKCAEYVAQHGIEQYLAMKAWER